jgi:hypothetical protein
MEQKGIPANPAQSGRLRDKSELQPALAGIANDPAWESIPIEPLLEIDTNLKRVIVCVTTFISLSRLIPRILLHCGNMMTHNNCGSSQRHKGCKEPLLPFSEMLN